MPYETNDAMIADLLKLGKDNKEDSAGMHQLYDSKGRPKPFCSCSDISSCASGTAYSTTTDRSAGFSPLSIKTE